MSSRGPIGEGVATRVESVGVDSDLREGAEHNVGLVGTGDDAPGSFDSPEEALDLVAALAEFGVELPRVAAILQRRPQS